MRVRRSLALLASSFAIVLSAPAVAGPETITYRSDFASAQPFVEIRARAGGITHAFVMTGYEYDNGLLVYNGGGGFYPKDGKLLALRVVQGTPGEIKLKDVDFTYDISFRAHVTSLQLQVVNNMLANWAVEKRYNLVSRNCVDFIRDVASTLGLDSTYRADLIGVPLPFVQDLRRNNQLNTPIKKEQLKLPKRKEEAEIRIRSERATLGAVRARNYNGGNPRPDLRMGYSRTLTDSYTDPSAAPVPYSSLDLGVGLSVVQGGSVVPLPQIGTGRGPANAAARGAFSSSSWRGVLPSIMTSVEVVR